MLKNHRELQGRWRNVHTKKEYTRVRERNGVYTVTTQGGSTYMTERKNIEPVVYTTTANRPCVQCDSQLIDYYIQTLTFHTCNNPSCANYALLQTGISADDMQ